MPRSVPFMMPAPKPVILIVEDDRACARLIALALQDEGFLTKTVYRARDALSAATCDAILLDLTLPDLDGIECCRLLREKTRAPILMLTGRTGTAARVRGLDAGGDDYLEKPFSFAELLSRLRALLRRHDPTLLSAQLRLLPTECALLLHGRRIKLTQTEYALFATLCDRRGAVLSREELLRCVWGEGEQNARMVDVNLSRLRAKLGPRDFPVVTVRGKGYRCVL